MLFIIKKDFPVVVGIEAAEAGRRIAKEGIDDCNEPEIF